MLQVAKVYWKNPTDYNPRVQITIDKSSYPKEMPIKKDGKPMTQDEYFISKVYEAAYSNCSEDPKKIQYIRRIAITNIEKISEAVLQVLALQNREFEISLNGKIIPSMKIPTAHYVFKPINYNNIPHLINDVCIIDDVTCGEVLQKYKGKRIPDQIFPEVMKIFQLYTTKCADIVTKKNKIEDWRLIEDFYVRAMHIGNTSKPTFKVYSPSGKTYLEEKFYTEYLKDIEDLEVDLVTELELIQTEMKNYDLNVPDIRVIRDSKQAFKTKYKEIVYEDTPLDEFTPFKIPKSTEAKFQGFTRPLDTIVYWPDKSELLKKYFNDTKDRNIPNVIRAELKPIIVQPNNWYNINHIYAEWLDKQPEEIRDEFVPLDSEICPVCLCRYNIYQGCIDPEHGEYHVEPLLENPKNCITATVEYYDSFGHTDDTMCFCKRVEAYIKSLEK